ncbi:MAG: aminodeoxychorismate synthase component I [Gammaproteobacteria bacterium]
MDIHALPYKEDSVHYFKTITHLPYAIFLDSCQPHGQQGRYDIMAAQPYVVITTMGDVSLIDWDSSQKKQSTTSTADPFTLIKEYVGETIANSTPYPFVGGALGYFGYDLNRRLEHIICSTENDIAIPDMVVGIYDWCVVVDHQEKTTHLLRQNRKQYHQDEWQTLQDLLLTSSHWDPVTITSEAQSNVTYEEYANAFQKIKHYLYDGDIYQANLSQRFHLNLEGCPLTLYRYLREKNPAPYAAYFQIKEGAILSLSPERFLQVSHKKVITKPIKGTRPRGKTLEEDERLRKELATSKKDQAENLMIVDLLRNDLSRICKTGSVGVPTLFALETFPSVHHLVSTVTGELDDSTHAVDLLRACFPGGSITGAPKIRAMEIIEELEPQRRTIYCGSMGYISYHGDMDTSICIRTLLQRDNLLYCWAGGAIVVDSQCRSEYEETYHKVDKILAILRQLIPSSTLSE